LGRWLLSSNAAEDAHTVVGFEADGADPENEEDGDGCPDDFEGDVTFDGGAVAVVVFGGALKDEGVEEGAGDADEDESADGGHEAEELIDEEGFGGGLRREPGVSLLAHPYADEEIGSEEENEVKDAAAGEDAAEVLGSVFGIFHGSGVRWGCAYSPRSAKLYGSAQAAWLDDGMRSICQGRSCDRRLFSVYSAPGPQALNPVFD